MRVASLALSEVACFDRLVLDFRPGSDPRKADIHVMVGENGTGKSTILRALAQFFERSPTGLRRRMRGSTAAAALGTGDGGQLKLRLEPGSRATRWEAWTADLLLGANTQALLDRHLKGTDLFAAFAYSGQRTVGPFQLRAIQEVTSDPRSTACDFEAGPSTAELVQWIATTRAKEAFAVQRGDADAARSRRSAIERVESALASIAGSPVRFEIREDPLDVSVDFRGSAVPVDLLPDGCGSRGVSTVTRPPGG